MAAHEGASIQLTLTLPDNNTKTVHMKPGPRPFAFVGRLKVANDKAVGSKISWSSNKKIGNVKGSVKNGHMVIIGEAHGMKCPSFKLYPRESCKGKMTQVCAPGNSNGATEGTWTVLATKDNKQIQTKTNLNGYHFAKVFNQKNRKWIPTKVSVLICTPSTCKCVPKCGKGLTYQKKLVDAAADPLSNKKAVDRARAATASAKKASKTAKKASKGAVTGKRKGKRKRELSTVLSARKLLFWPRRRKFSTKKAMKTLAQNTRPFWNKFFQEFLKCTGDV